MPDERECGIAAGQHVPLERVRNDAVYFRRVQRRRFRSIEADSRRRGTVDQPPRLMNLLCGHVVVEPEYNPGHEVSHMLQITDAVTLMRVHN